MKMLVLNRYYRTFLTYLSRPWFEPLLFAVVLTIFLFPFYNSGIFPTLDGPAHIYNANLLKHLLDGNGETIPHFFQINNANYPNWTGHLILTSLLYLFDSYWSEKLLQIGLVIGISYSFRKLVSTLYPNNKTASYLIFPFVYGMNFYYGFYNFTLAIVFFFLLFRLWYNYSEKPSYKKLPTLFITAIALYFSHFFVFGVGVLLCFTFELQKLYQQRKGYSWGKLIGLFLTFMVPISLAYNYYSNRVTGGPMDYLSIQDLILSLLNLDAMVGYNYEKELPYTMFIAIIIGCMLVFAFVLSRRTNKLFAIPVGVLFLLILYFYLPNKQDFTGYISIRIQYFIYLLIILWIAQFSEHQFIRILMTINLIASLYLLDSRSQLMREKNKDFKELSTIRNQIEDHAVVLPIDFSNRWLLNNFSNFIGVEKDVVVLQNYEATATYFPIAWKDSEEIMRLKGFLIDKNLACLDWQVHQEEILGTVDYMLITGEIPSNDTCNVNLQGILDKSTEETYRSELYGLYKVLK